VPCWQNDGSVVLGLAVGLIAHLVGRDVPRHFAFSGEVDVSGVVTATLLPSEAALRSMVARGVRTLILGRAPVDAEAVAIPEDVTVHRATFVVQVLDFVWP
jgi:predicted ATP-dependent serine protease